MKVKELIKRLTDLKRPDWEVYFCMSDTTGGTDVGFPIVSVDRRRADSAPRGCVQIAGEETADATAAVLFSNSS
jgi:hypothetical protein